jgi:hypothetical protein
VTTKETEGERQEYREGIRKKEKTEGRKEIEWGKERR